MCRFVLYQGAPLTIASLVTEPAHSIINQSFHAKEADEPLNGDGFGLAWYNPALSDRPALFRSVTPAWSNQNLLELARVTQSGNVLCHVRAATRGLPVSETNCHPFTNERYAFMHNGDIARFHQIRRRLLADMTDPAFMAIKGSTDSEHLFGVFLDEAGDADVPGAVDRGAALARALERAVRRVLAVSEQMKLTIPPAPGDDDESYVNVAVSDGVCSAACRAATGGVEPASLYVHYGRRYVCEGGVCQMVRPEQGHGAVLIASERLSADEGWQKIPANHVVIVREDNSVDIRPMAA